MKSTNEKAIKDEARDEIINEIIALRKRLDQLRGMITGKNFLEKQMAEDSKTIARWMNNFGWNHIKDKWPKSNTEVVVFYISDGEEGTNSYTTEVMHEKFIADLKSPLYWIEKPE